jgi:hypothetical protein
MLQLCCRETFILGEKPTLSIKVEVENVGEPAFLTRINLVIPKVTPVVEIPSICYELSSQEKKETSTLICEIGYPLEKKVNILFTSFFMTNVVAK